MTDALRFVVASFILIVISMGTARAIDGAAVRESQDVNLSVSIGDSSQRIIDVELEYTGRTPVRIYKSDLPWGIRRSIVLIAVCLDGARTVIPELEYIDDPMPEIITLAPGQQLHGTIRLDERFPGFREKLRKNDALLFWSYQLLPIDTKPTSRVSGGILIPRMPTQSN